MTEHAGLDSGSGGDRHFVVIPSALEGYRPEPCSTSGTTSLSGSGAAERDFPLRRREPTINRAERAPQAAGVILGVRGGGSIFSHSSGVQIKSRVRQPLIRQYAARDSGAGPLRPNLPLLPPAKSR